MSDGAKTKKFLPEQEMNVMPFPLKRNFLANYICSIEFRPIIFPAERLFRRKTHYHDPFALHAF